MIYIHYDFQGSLNLTSYNNIVQRIMGFDEYENIGKDQSGQYDMYVIHMGDRTKPTIFVDASMHGTEWQGTFYTLDFFEQIKNDTFPDKILRDRLLSDFHIVYLPVMNPWGFDRTTELEPRTRNRGRRNSNNIDLNGDFNNFTQRESLNVKSILDRELPFAYMNNHLMTPETDRNQNNNLIIGNGQGATNYVKEDWIRSLSYYTDESVTNWAGFTKLSRGLSRRYVRDLNNPYTPHTLSYITEINRPQQFESGSISRPLTNNQIYKYGMANVYLFFVTSLKYFDEQVNGIPYESVDNQINDEFVNEIKYPHKTYLINRESDGTINSIIEDFKDGNKFRYSFIRENNVIMGMNKEQI